MNVLQEAIRLLNSQDSEISDEPINGKEEVFLDRRLSITDVLNTTSNNIVRSVTPMEEYLQNNE
jgi:hypothetical protein